MSAKTVIQLVILVIIFVIVAGVYIKYFSKERIVVDQMSQQNEGTINTNSEEKNKTDDQKEVVNSANIDESRKEKKTETNKIDLEKSKEKKTEKGNSKSVSNKIDSDMLNTVKNVEYLTADKNGNKYKILATSGKTNQNDKNILDLENVSGEITSNERSTIYITSDFAEYNSSTLGSKFYKDVVINYEDKQINCDNFDINMDTNIAIAYNNVVVTDPNSTMRAGKIALNIETKEIDINPGIGETEKIIINTKQ